MTNVSLHCIALFNCFQFISVISCAEMAMLLITGKLEYTGLFFEFCVTVLFLGVNLEIKDASRDFLGTQTGMGSY